MSEIQKSFLRANGFTERDIQEIEFAMIYAKDFKHGTDGHNRLLIIARFSFLLDNFISLEMKPQ